MLYDAESSDKWELTLDKFKQGLHQWICKHPDMIDDGEIYTSNIDAWYADDIIQFALFGEVRY